MNLCGRPPDGIQQLDDYLLGKQGLDLGDWTLHQLVDMTPDGRVLIGNAMHPEFGSNVAVRIVIPEPHSLMLGLCAVLA